MAYLFRSEDMKYVTLTMPKDVAESFTRRLGERGLVHIADLPQKMTVEEASRSKQVQAMKLYKKRIVGCTSAEKRVQAFERLLADYNLELPVIDPRERKLQKDVLSQFENDWKPLEMELKINITAARKLQTEISRMEEERHVLFECKENINIEQEVKELKASVAVRSRGRRGDIKSPLLDDDIELQGMQAEKKFYKYICGTIPDTQKIFFERMLYRVSRGNAFVRYLDITGEVVDEKTGDVRTEPVKVLDPRTGELITKSVFYIVTIGRGLKLSKLCDFFQASIYVVPQSMSAYEKRVADIKTAVSDRRAVLRTTKIQIRKLLRQISYDSESGSSMLIDWRSILRKEKLLCAALRKCHHVHTYVSLEGWIADDDLQALRDECDLASAGHKLPISFTVKSPEGKDAGDVGRPPTYFKTNSFTGVYQNIVNTYGVPRYKEVNPGLFTIVTFPFTFGVMYGDMGHGGTLFLVALYFLYNEQYYLDQQRRGKMGELMDYAFGSRYALILMGFFGFYCGSIYNDFISVPFQTFDSMWKEPANFTNTNQHYEYAGGGAHYPYGIDYNWYHRKNELTFFNSLKMKMSVMIGVTQMTFGIVLGVFNHIYFKDMTSLYYVWIPQMLFMICTFGYMNIMIIYKWCQDYSSNGLQPPSLIQTMIKMFLSPGAIDGDPLYSGQAGVQVFLILLAVLSVPVMLLVKPILEDRKNRAAHGDAAGNDYQADGDAKRSQSFSGSRDDGIPSFIDDEKQIGEFDSKDPEDSKEPAGGDHGDDEHDGHSFSELVIHQAIHTIEFVLGAVSNTASYLRLWALSLAHAQLAKVFWQKMIIEYGAETEGGLGIVMMVATYAMWFCATFAVLMCMDLLECFLHALRLHWVEFQNKFFNADGYLFDPFTFEKKSDDA